MRRLLGYMKPFWWVAVISLVFAADTLTDSDCRTPFNQDGGRPLPGSRTARRLLDPRGDASRGAG